jgi:hypothetical protein
MVAFMDLLGYRHVLNELDALPLPTDEAGVVALRAALGRSVRFRRRLHASFEQFLRGHDLAPDLEDEVPPDFRGIIHGLRSIKLINSPGPDHYILASSLARSEEHFPVRGAYALVVAVAAGMLIQLARGWHDPTDTLPLRGGIDIAPGAVVLPEEFLYSPAVVRAYELEGSAVYPRTLVGDRVQDFLRSVAAMPGGDVASQYARQVAARVGQMFFTDSDGKLAVDFYGPVVRETFGDQPARTLGPQAWEYAVAALAAARTSGNARVVEKYDWLLTYMEPRRQLWI